MSKPTTPGTRTPAGAKTPAAGTRTPVAGGSRTPATAEAGGGSLPRPLVDQQADAKADLNVAALPPASSAPPEVAALIHPPPTTAGPPAEGEAAGAAPPAESGPAPTTGNDDDDDGDVSSDASSECYDPVSGEPIVSETMSDRRKQKALDRALQKQQMEDVLAEPTTAVQPLRPRRTAAQIRAESMRILQEAREDIADDLGIPPVKVNVDGRMMPRQACVTIAKPLTLKDDHGNVTYIAPPATGFGLNEKFDQIEQEKTKEQTTVQHYSSSLDALKKAKQQRLLRQLELE